MDRFPALSGAALRRLLVVLCGPPERGRGSHQTFRSRAGTPFTYAFHDRKEVTGSIVRRILVNDVGLSEDEALHAVRKGKS